MFERRGEAAKRSMKPHIMETMHMLNTPRLSLFLPSPNRMTALNMPAETKGMSRLAVCTIKSAEPYCSFVSTRVYKGIRRNTNALEAKVPDCKYYSVGKQFFIFIHFTLTVYNCLPSEKSRLIPPALSPRASA